VFQVPLCQGGEVGVNKEDIAQAVATAKGVKDVVIDRGTPDRCWLRDQRGSPDPAEKPTDGLTAPSSLICDDS